MQFDFILYDQDGDRVDDLTRDMASVDAAKRFAKAQSRTQRGAVDVAYADNRDWNDRYITTASFCTVRGAYLTRLD
jgi:hypothetical protein